MGNWGRNDDVLNALPMALMHGYKEDSERGGDLLSKFNSGFPAPRGQNLPSTGIGASKNVNIVFKDCSFRNCTFNFGDK